MHVAVEQNPKKPIKVERWRSPYTSKGSDIGGGDARSAFTQNFTSYKIVSRIQKLRHKLQMLKRPPLNFWNNFSIINI